MDLYQRGITVINILKIQKYFIIMIIPISGFLLAIQFLKLAGNHLEEAKKYKEKTTTVS
jgi:TRAP-type C4-dicarboxylate transport system permease small subunit